MPRIFFLILILCAAPAWALQNQLAEHPSPYLAMHGDDPVAWQDWGEAAIAQAREQDKLIFLSSGYFSCHWCHVMQRESYRNPEIAAWLNEHFIPVKLDRELHPALDAYLIDFLERTQGQAGWPLNIFLTPEGYPLIGATYLPPERFSELLQRLQATWDGRRSHTRNLARRALLKLLANRDTGEFQALPFAELRTRLLRQALSVGDPMEGGFGEQNKFPMSPQLLALLELRGSNPAGALDLLLQTTLDQMAEQGLRDHLGGGFFRYTVDPSWQVPHFEKMLYTQAQLARVYLLAGQLYGREDYLALARETLDFALREMPGQHGLMIASFSAVDEQGEEGGPYLWTEEQLRYVLSEQDTRLAQRVWALQGPPLLEFGWLPRRGESLTEIAAQLEQPLPALQQRVERIREQLLIARKRRDLPADDKELAAWNGLLLGALARAGQQLNEPRYLEAALALAKNLRQRLWHDGELWRARAGDAAVGAAALEDYAYVADGVGALLRAAPQAAGELADWHTELVRSAWQRFHSPRGWKVTEKPLIPGLGEEPAMRDGALLSPLAVLLRETARGGDAFTDLPLAEAVRASQRPLQEEPFWFPSQVLVLGEVGEQAADSTR